jgi:hypothetical protein
VPLAEDGEAFVDLLDVLPDAGTVGAGVGSREEVLVHGEFREDATTLHHWGDPGAHHLRRRGMVDRLSLEEDLSSERVDETQDRLYGRGLAGGVGAEEAHQFSLSAVPCVRSPILCWPVRRAGNSGVLPPILPGKRFDRSSRGFDA